MRLQRWCCALWNWIGAAGGLWGHVEKTLHGILSFSGYMDIIQPFSALTKNTENLALHEKHAS